MESSHALTAQSTVMVRVNLGVGEGKRERERRREVGGESSRAILLSIFSEVRYDLLDRHLTDLTSCAPECTYDKPSNRRRNPAPQYIEALESRLQRAEGLLRKFMPDVDLADPNLDPAVQQEFNAREQARIHGSKARSHITHAPAPSPAPDSGAKLMTMIDSIGQLDLDDKGGWDFHGTSSGAVFLKRMKEHFRGLLGPVIKGPSMSRSERASGLTALDVRIPGAGASSTLSSLSHYTELPPKDVARRLCYYSLSCATCLVRIVHIPSFNERFERVYDQPVETLNQEDTHFLGLVHAVIALGCMYNNLEDKNPVSGGYKLAIEEGFVSPKWQAVLPQHSMILTPPMQSQILSRCEGPPG